MARRQPPTHGNHGIGHMKTLPLPPLELLQEFFEVDETSPSGLRWKKYRAHNAKPGDVAGWLNKTLNRWQICFLHRKYLCYRIQFYLQTKIDPYGFEIDHANLNTTDTKTLRISTREQNELNKPKILIKNGKQATSKYKGVDWREEKKKWRVRVANKFIGYFKTEKEAAHAYNEAVLKYCGEFARLNIIDE